MKTLTFLLIAIATALAPEAAFADSDSAALFKKKCSICHKLDKKAMGPAIKAMSADTAVLKSAIADGRKAMPSFSKQLDDGQIDALVAYIQEQQK